MGVQVMGRFLKWLLLAIVVAGGAFYLYQRNIQPVPVTAADLEKGGSFSVDERTALTAACSTRIKQDGEKACACIADKVATEFSRFDRMVLTATFQGKLAEIVGITKGLVQSGIPAEKVKSAEEGSKARVQEMLKTCKATATP
jgi:hypothetical protein